MARVFRIDDNGSPHVLRPWVEGEAISISEAAAFAGVATATMRRWVARFDIGRHVGAGHWRVSKPALLMVIEADAKALRAYHDGQKNSPLVRRYFLAVGMSAAA